MAFHLLPLQPGGGTNAQAPPSQHSESNGTNPASSLNPMSAPGLGRQQANRVEGSNNNMRGLGVPARHPRRHTSYHNPIPSTWQTPPERQLGYGERTFGGWRDDWRDAGEKQNQTGTKHRSRRSDIGPETTDSSYHQADSAYHIGMGFGLDALRKKRRVSSPARSRSTNMDTYEDSVDGSASGSQTFSNDVTMTSASPQQRSNPVSTSSSTRHRRSNSSEGLLDNNVKSEGSSMSPSSHLTFKGVRSMKHGKSDKAYQEGMRKASSLQDLTTATSIDGDDIRHSRQEDSLYRSRSRESLPDNPSSYSAHRRPVSDISHFATPHTDLHLHANGSDGDMDSDSKPKTFFETLRDSLLNPEPPKPKNYRYLKLAGIPTSRTIENYGTDVSIKSNVKRTGNNAQQTMVHDRPSATNTGVYSNNIPRNNSIHSSGGVNSPNDNKGYVSSRNSSFSPHVVTNQSTAARNVTNNQSVGGNRWNAKIETNQSKTSTNIDRKIRCDHRNDLRSDFDHKRLLHEPSGVSIRSMFRGGITTATHSVGTSGGGAGSLRPQEERGRERYRTPQPAPTAVAPRSFAWEPKGATSTTFKGSSVRGSGEAAPTFSSFRAPSATVHHPSQARHTTRSNTAPIPSPAASGVSHAKSEAGAASRPREWHASGQGHDSPPAGSGSSTGSSESYEDYFCRSPSPNSFFVNGRSKNETDEHKVSRVNSLTSCLLIAITVHTLLVENPHKSYRKVKT